MIYYILLTLYIISCFVLIMFVLLQPGKSDAAAVFGGGANSSAFGPRGTQTVLAKVTITAAIIFFLTAFLFSIPGVFERKSVGEGAGPAETQPITPDREATVPVPPADQAPGASTTPPTQSQPAATDTKPAQKGAEKKSEPAKPNKKN